MTSSKFLLVFCSFTVALVLGFGAVNFWLDDFGLFWRTEPRTVWIREKTSKHLFAHRYIPQNFEGVLMGPSYSDSFMDTQRIDGYRIYNMSMDGANATEIRSVALPAIERGNMRFIIVCLTPYITKDHGIKGAEISPKEYLGSLYSLLPVDVFKAKLASGFRSNPDKASPWGMTQFIERPHITWERFMATEANGSNYYADLDPVAVEHLGDVLKAARAKNIQVFAYFYPYNRWFTDSVDAAMWQRYRTAVEALFEPGRDVLWDMTAPEYDPLRTDPGCYTDAHLSAAGARVVLADIKRVLDAHYKGIQGPLPFEPNDPTVCYGKPGQGSGYDRPAHTIGKRPDPATAAS